MCLNLSSCRQKKKKKSVLVWVLQRSITGRTYRERLDHKELAHTVMEAERPQDLQLASRRPRRAHGLSSSPSLKAGEDGVPPAQLGREEEFSLGFFVRFRPPADWVRTTHLGEVKVLSSGYWFRCSSHAETLSGTHPESRLSTDVGTLWPSWVDTEN